MAMLMGGSAWAAAMRAAEGVEVRKRWGSTVETAPSTVEAILVV